MNKYDHKKLEKKWQAYWQAKKTFIAKDFSKKPKKFVLVEFPYPSGEGLHMGHLRPYVAADVYSRYHRMKGNNVIFPMGWDAFGLPAENFAIKKGVHPSVSTKKNVANAKRQIQSWGLSFDWSREVNTTDPNYYKWTQWIFLQFYKAGLAFEATGLINWCPKDKTGLANEEVIDGKCERCGTVVEKKELRQWYLKITAYAEKLLEGLKNLPAWPEPIKLQQENWIGKSTGAEIEFILDQPPVKRFVLLHGRTTTGQGVFFPWLKKELEKRGFEVQTPTMPNTEMPDDVEQAEFVKKNCTLDEQTVVIGHSSGGIVALRLLEQGIKINRCILVSTPFSGKFLDGKERPSVTKACKKGFNFEVLKKNCYTLLYDTEDKIVPMSDGEAFEKKLGFGLFKYKAKKDHFDAKEEPEVLAAALGTIKVFTTRPDTIFGATYLVLAPEHQVARAIALQVENKGEVENYIESAQNKTDIQRSAVEKEKTGVHLKGAFAINPATGEKIPIWVADYVLMGYGTGAIMAVPAHDERDFEFAKKYSLPIKQVVKGSDHGDLTEAMTEDGFLINSDVYNGLETKEAIERMGVVFGRVTTQFKLRDWVFSRQRYWGEPIPIIHCPQCGIVPVPEKDLPVKLPNVKKYEPTGTGESPLAAIDKWVNVKCPNCKSPAKRETNTMPQWAGSSWYWLRYADPNNKKEFASTKKLKYWNPVDVYFGGMEHTTLHLLYSRFWNLFLYDQGLVTEREPYTKRKPHGLILAEDGEKMSKSRGNVVNPDDVVKSDGADTLRMYELFLGPHEQSVSWNKHGHVGVRRFLDRVWYWANEKSNPFQPPPLKRGGATAVTPSLENRGQGGVQDSDKVQRALHKLIKKIGEDIENFSFNTSISAFMEFHNQVKEETISLSSLKIFLTLLYPFAPHVAEELNETLGSKKSLQLESWPAHDPALTVDQTVEIVVQVNGKVKGKLEIQNNSDQASVESLAKDVDSVKSVLESQVIKKVIFVPNRLINFVI